MKLEYLPDLRRILVRLGTLYFALLKLLQAHPEMPCQFGQVCSVSAQIKDMLHIEI